MSQFLFLSLLFLKPAGVWAQAESCKLEDVAKADAENPLDAEGCALQYAIHSYRTICGQETPQVVARLKKASEACLKRVTKQTSSSKNDH